MLTASLDIKRGRLGSITGLVTKQQSKASASGFGNNPGERSTSQTGPGEESRRRRAAARDNAL